MLVGTWRGKRTSKQVPLVAVEVMEGVTKCQVAAGEEAIKEKFNSGEKLIVIVDKQGTAAGGFLKGLVGA